MGKRLKNPLIAAVSFRCETCLMVLLISLAIMFCGCNESRQPQNLLLIVSDALRRDIVSCYGGPAHTPNIDRLAREGTVFDNAYCTAPTTMPSAVSMLTGCYSRTFAFDQRTVYLDYLDQRVPSTFFRVGDGLRTFTEAMRDRGVDTRVSMENGLVRVCNLLQGFSRLREKNQLTAAQRRHVEKQLNFCEENKSYKAMYGTLDYLIRAKADQPFFLFKWIFDPHFPYDPPPRFLSAANALAATLPRPQNFYTDLKDAELRAKLDNNRMNLAEQKYLRALYRAEVESVDHRVGAILKALEAGGQRDRTLIVFTSDHGECLGDYAMYGHGRAVHPPLVRVPLIFSGPGIPRGRRVASLISHLDLTPTLAEIFRIHDTAFMQGKSYAGIFRGEQLPDREVYFDFFSNVLELWTGVDAILSAKKQLVVDRRQATHRSSLYDLLADPAAVNDVAARNASVVNKLFSRIQAIRRENQKLMRVHSGLVADNLDAAAEREKTRRLLQSLGYL